MLAQLTISAAPKFSFKPRWMRHRSSELLLSLNVPCKFSEFAGAECFEQAQQSLGTSDSHKLVSSAVGTKTSVGGTWRDTQIWWQLLPGDNPEKAGCGPAAVSSPGNTTALEGNTCCVLRHSVTCMTECLMFLVRKGSSGISGKDKVIWVHLSRSSLYDYFSWLKKKKNVGQNQIPINRFIVQ